MSETVYPGALDNITPTELRNSPSLASVLNALQQTLGITGAFNFFLVTGGTITGAVVVDGELTVNNILNMDSHKIESLANGTASTDGAAFGQIPLLTQEAGVLGSPYTLTGSPTTFLSTASLSVGKWLVIFTGASAGSSGSAEVTLTEGTATATFTGPTSSEVSIVGLFEAPLSFACFAHVTVAGALAFQGEGGSASLVATATGYVAVLLP